MSPRLNAFDLVMATDRLPIADGTDPVLGRAHAALMHAVASRRGAWVAATDAPWAAATSWLHPLHLAVETLTGWRDGQCATTLASAYFGFSGITPPQDPAWKAAYEQVNRRYAAAIAQRARDGAAIWLHDYPLQLVPAMLRRQRPDLRIGFTLHSPLPPAESFQTLAGRDELLAGLAAADVVSFTDERSQANFTAIADEAGVSCGRTMVMPMPVDARAIAHLAEAGAVQAHAARIRARLRPASVVFLSIGDHDPGDGALQRLQEFARLLDSGRLPAERCAYIHLAHDTAQLCPDLGRLTAQINGQHGRLGHAPVHYQRGAFSLAELVAFYLAADVMLATPMRDRATPRAAEWAAARASGYGRMVLSEFSATKLPGAIVVNPHEPEALGEAMLSAAAQCHTPSPEIRTMRDAVLACGITAWADRFLDTLKPAQHRATKGRLQQTWRAMPALRHQEGSRKRGQASDTGGQLTVTAPHP
jgi:trehalose 6-phosphate synthase